MVYPRGRKGLASAGRDELLSDAEVGARLEKRLTEKQKAAY